MKTEGSEIVKKAMESAVELALQARGQTSPNPMVGAVLISNTGAIIGRGFHARAGAPHAEVVAIKDALSRDHDLRESSLIVTLEPCNHFGRTPPCTDLIVSSGIKSVFFGSIDPNPQMSGKSQARLEAQGIFVESGILKERCDQLIRGFKSVMKNKRPFVTLKAATSLDGKIATASGESQWITDVPARQMGHRERSEHDTILVGVGTVLADDPQLTARQLDFSGSPVTARKIKKVILDSQLRTPPSAKLFGSQDEVLIYCEWNYSEERKLKLEQAGATVIPSGSAGELFTLDSLHLKKVLEDLARRGSQEILVEGGARVLGAFVREKLFDRMMYFIAPKIFGSESRDVFEGLHVDRLQDSVELENISTHLVGHDVVIEGTRSCSPA